MATIATNPPASGDLAAAVRLSRPRFVMVVLAANLLFDVGMLSFAEWAELRAYSPRRYYMEAFISATFFTQAFMLAVWAALFPGAALFRQASAALVLLAGVYALALVAQCPYAWDGMLRTFLVRFWDTVAQSLFFMVFFLAAQMPFWLARWAMDFKVVHESERGASHAGTGRRFNLLHLLAATAFVAVALSLVRIIAPLWSLAILLVRIVSVTALAAVFGFAFIWAALSPKRASHAIGAFLLVSATLIPVGSYITYHVLNVSWRDWPVVVVSLCFSQIAVVLVGLGTALFARAAGYRLGTLSWKRATQQLPAPATTSSAAS